jgi:hypothetical protein
MTRHPFISTLSLMMIVAVLFIWWRFQSDMTLAHARVSHGSILIDTACGPIEYQEAGSGEPLLSVHGLCCAFGKAGHPRDRHVKVWILAHSHAD